MALKSAVVGALGNATWKMKKDSGSAGATPCNKPETSRVSANAAAMPMTIPPVDSRAPSPTTMTTTSAAVDEERDGQIRD